jgi:hypothetical protein
MDLYLMVQLGLGAGMAMLLTWFYPHCARPALAFAGSRPLGFWLALAGAVIGAVAWIGSPVLDALGAEELAEATGPLRYVGGLALLGYVRPTWLVRLAGGPDGSVPPRFLLTWYARWWQKVGVRGARAQQIEWLRDALRDLRPPADPAIVAAWVDELDALTHLGEAGDFAALTERLRDLYEKLARLRPVEPLGALP